ncbi:NAD-dependent epimerase/dehydratase family protein [Amycolatopsis alkalitolerans]|uniref:NAD-dependent epimerase/dehydratase family protein n=1 Tax=Amycolatopsis alkalitolerans TaxID=2547244 RepID=A0A5C4M7Y8_9PSEU|nr:NAD-dependent epimerase/dehydratase family protein [Amycolatopsis alkalitolerans]TNC28171.1 NAD-dependent epimerase/dehydratase family protein [Amycolatopsis alkalitolerans]
MSDDWFGRRVVVTGGSGFIGRAVVAALCERGAAVTVADREPFPDTPGVRSVAGDLTDPEVRREAVAPGTTAIVHLAAVTSVLGSVDAPVRTFDDNVAVTQGLLELARERAVARFVLASTNAVTGNVGTSTIYEQLPLRPLTPYGATKAACEMLMSGYAGAYGLGTCALRLTNVYGPGMSHKDSFVPRLMRAALSGDRVRIYGDGRQRRDLVHVDDVVAAMLAAVETDYSGTAIVGSGRSVSVLELVAAAREATACPLPVDHVEAPAGEMPAVIVDTSRAAEALGYRSRVGLTDGLASTWQYFRETGPA